MNNNTIQWYPGHMFKAKKEIQAVLKTIDVVVEIIDSRVPLASHNEMLDEITKGKQKLLVFSKCDYVNPSQLQKYMNHYQNLGYETIAANLKNTTENKKVIKKINAVSEEIIAKYAKRGVNKVIRVLVMGMPNVGKSTFINFLMNQKKVNIGNKPGVTKQQQWIRLNESIELLDTPGILVPKIHDIRDGYNLVLCSLIKDEVVNKEDVAVYMLRTLDEKYQQNLKERYQIEYDEFDIEEIYNLIGKKIGALLPRSEIDYDRVTNTIVNDFRNQRFGLLILDEI